jgi:hypothetical protein|tara:strand:+ start:139 stop:246 length:108 start_codon:yes stop_codon:yes gene_type:complete
LQVVAVVELMETLAAEVELVVLEILQILLFPEMFP